MRDPVTESALALAFVGAIVIVLTFAQFHNARLCASAWGDLQTQYFLIGGCEVNVEGKWIKSETY